MRAKQKIENTIDNLSEYNIAVTLGSGLGGFESEIDVKTKLSYNEIPGFVDSTVDGHKGELIFGSVSEQNIIAQNGRIHYYETGNMNPVVKPIRLLYEMGIEYLLLTNAAGGVNPRYSSGDMMIIEDHINNLGDNPLIGSTYEDQPQFPDMTEVYDTQLIALLEDSAEILGLDIQKGVYVANTGPSYETPAEIQMVQTIGGDAVGMSTVPEAIVANQHNMKVAGLSTITNLAAGVSDTKLSHTDVEETAEKVQNKVNSLVSVFISQI